MTKGGRRNIYVFISFYSLKFLKENNIQAKDILSDNIMRRRSAEGGSCGFGRQDPLLPRERFKGKRWRITKYWVMFEWEGEGKAALRDVLWL